MKQPPCPDFSGLKLEREFLTKGRSKEDIAALAMSFRRVTSRRSLWTRDEFGVSQYRNPENPKALPLP